MTSNHHGISSLPLGTKAFNDALPLDSGPRDWYLRTKVGFRPY